MANPLVPQGVINRLVASVTWNNFSNLNVTGPFLGKPGIRMAFSGPTTTPIPTMTGVVQSPEPYQQVNVQIPLLKTQQLGDLYKRQIELLSLLGDGIVRPDVATGGISAYQLSNCSIADVGELNFGGEDAIFGVVINGIYYINSSLFQ